MGRAVNPRPGTRNTRVSSILTLSADFGVGPGLRWGLTTAISIFRGWRFIFKSNSLKFTPWRAYRLLLVSHFLR